jgi:hypothetical protein
MNNTANGLDDLLKHITNGTRTEKAAEKPEKPDRPEKKNFSNLMVKVHANEPITKFSEYKIESRNELRPLNFTKYKINLD